MTTYQHGEVSLEWARTRCGAWDLRDEQGLRARLAADAQAWIATASNEAWSVQRVGFHRPRLVVRPRGALAEIAHLQQDWHGHGTLRFASGPSYDIERSPAAGLTVRTPDGRSVLRAAWSGHDSASARVLIDAGEASGRFGTVILLVTGSLLIDDRGDATRPLSVGARLGPSVRARFA